MRWLLRLYPRNWRERYEEEMLGVLEQHKITAATVLDLLLGALDANLNYEGVTEGVADMVSRLRSGIIMVFCAFVVFGLGWSMIQRINDPVNLFQMVAKSHPEFMVLHEAIIIGGGLSFLALLIGGLPLFFIAVKRGIKIVNVRRPFAVALSCLLLFLLSTLGLANWNHLSFAKTHIYLFLISYFIVFLVLLSIGTVAVSIILARTDFQLVELQFLFIPEIVIVFGMVVSVLVSIVFIVALTAYAPDLFNTQDVSSQMFVTGIIFMALGTIFAGIGLRRGISLEKTNIR